MTLEVESKKEAKDRGRRHAVPDPILPKEVTMKVRMLQTRPAAPDGIHVQEFKAGEVYDLPPSLAEPWLSAKVCEQDKLAPGPSEFKADEAPAAGKSGKKKGGATPK
jgi:hypothetical protein